MTDPFAVPPAGAPTPEPVPLYGEPLRGPARNGAGVAALVLGLVSIPFGVLIIPPVLAIVFGIIGRRRSARGEASNPGVALAGLVTGAIGLLIGVLLLIGLIRVFTSPEWDHYVDCNRAAVTTEQQNACVRQLTDDIVGTSR